MLHSRQMISYSMIDSDLSQLTSESGQFLEKRFQQRLGMRLEMVSFQPLLKPLKRGGTTSKVVSMRFLCSMATITSVGLWLRRARALDKPGGLKSSYDTTFGLIIVKAKPMGLLILCLASPREVKTRRISCELNLTPFAVFADQCKSIRPHDQSQSFKPQPFRF